MKRCKFSPSKKLNRVVGRTHKSLRSEDKSHLRSLVNPKKSCNRCLTFFGGRMVNQMILFQKRLMAVSISNRFFGYVFPYDFIRRLNGFRFHIKMITITRTEERYGHDLF